MIQLRALSCVLVEGDLGHPFVLAHSAVTEKFIHAHAEHTSIHIPVIEGSPLRHARRDSIEFMLFHVLPLHKKVFCMHSQQRKIGRDLRPGLRRPGPEGRLGDETATERLGTRRL